MPALLSPSRLLFPPRRSGASRRSCARAFRTGLSAGLFLLALRGVAAMETDDQYHARTWTTDDGLPHNFIISIVQDKQGYLWLATTGGLCRYDGNQLKEIPLPAQYHAGGFNIRGLAAEDPDTLLLLPASGHVVRLRDGKFSPHPVSALTAGRRTTELFVEPGGALWLSLQDGGLLRWENGQGRWIGAADTPIPRTGRTTFAVDGQGVTWFASGSFLGRYHEGQLIRSSLNIGEPLAIASGRDGAIWICTATRLLKFANQRLSVLSDDPPWKDALGTVQCHFEDSEGTLWIASGRLGLFRWADGRFAHVTTPYAIVMCAAEDREGNLWVGTGGSGLGQLHRKAYRLFDSSSGLTEDLSNTVLRDRAGDIWLGNNSGGVVHLKDDQPVPLNLSLDGKRLYLSTACFDTSGTLWAGGPRGLYRVAPPFTDPPEKLPLPEVRLHLLYCSRKGDVWFAADPEQFGYFRKGVPHLFTESDGYDGQTIRAITEDRDGQIWAGSFNGDLFRITGDRLVRVLPGQGLEGQPIHDLLMDESGALWIATATGLLLKQGERFRLFTQEDGLADELISQLVEDDRGQLWCSSRSGLYFVAKAELFSVARGETPQVFSHRVGRDQGLVGISPLQNYHPSATKTADGRLWFATSKGVVAFDPGKLRPPPSAPPVFIDDVVVNGRSVPARDRLEIPPGAHRIEFRFTAPSYTSPESVRIRHQLEGADPAWVATNTTRTTSYSGLAPGHYTLRVMAADSTGSWSEPGATLAFRVLPRWWQTGWFQLGALAAFGVGTACGVRRRSQLQLKRRLRRLEQEQALHAERSRIARDLHDHLGGNLTEVSLLVERLRHTEPAGLTSGLAALASHTRRLGAELDSIVWIVSPRNASLDRLASFLSRYALRLFQHSSTQCTVNLAATIPARPLAPDVQHHLLATAKEALINVLKHAHATRMVLALTYTDGIFQFAIADDGLGFDSHRTLDEGNGLNNMRERIAEIGGRLQIESAPGRGTTITVDYPAPPSASPESAALRRSTGLSA